MLAGTGKNGPRAAVLFALLLIGAGCRGEPARMPPEAGRSGPAGSGWRREFDGRRDAIVELERRLTPVLEVWERLGALLPSERGRRWPDAPRRVLSPEREPQQLRALFVRPARGAHRPVRYVLTFWREAPEAAAGRLRIELTLEPGSLSRLQRVRIVWEPSGGSATLVREPGGWQARLRPEEHGATTIRSPRLAVLVQRLERELVAPLRAASGDRVP